MTKITTKEQDATLAKEDGLTHGEEQTSKAHPDTNSNFLGKTQDQIKQYLDMMRGYKKFKLDPLRSRQDPK